MTKPSIDDGLLQQYLDDELDAAARHEVEALLAEPEREHDHGRVRATERLGDFVRDVASDAAESLDDSESAALWEGVLAGIAQAEADPPSGERAGAASEVDAEDGRKRPKLRLIAGEGLGTLPPRTDRVAFEPRLGSGSANAEPVRTGAARAEGTEGARSPGEPKRSIWPGVFAATALAAAALLAIFARPSSSIEIAEPTARTEQTEPPVVQTDSDPEVIVAAHHGSEVEAIDFGQNTGTVFQVQGEQDVPIAVVWISDEEFVR